jgi:LmbE family N-acetylglucosaminyl deacetylase
MWQLMQEKGIEVPDRPAIDPERLKRMEDAERRITTTVNVSTVAEAKWAALAAHASQLDESWWLRFPPELFSEVFGHETFIRARDTTGVSLPEDDLFAGLR